MIQHGAPANIAAAAVPTSRAAARSILTWGLLGPGKGIEHAIEALAELRDLDPPPRYVVLGQTHPNIVRHSGEAYRESLQALAAERGVEELVEFDDAYRDTAEVLAEIRDADVVLLPYLSRDQVVSGVLVEAIASGKPVVSTAFPHAVELLSAGLRHRRAARGPGGDRRGAPDAPHRPRGSLGRRGGRPPAGGLAHLGDRRRTVRGSSRAG